MLDHAPQAATSIATTAERMRKICAQLAPAWQRRVTSPVLSTVLVQASPTGTIFTTTDLELTIRVAADDLTSAQPWSACINFDLLRRLAGTLTGPLQITFAKADASDTGKMDQITLTTDDGISATANLLCQEDDFPVLPDALDDPLSWHVMELTPADLRRYIDLSAPCVSTQETRYYLNSIHLCRKPGGTTLRMVATDGYRMAIIDGKTEAPEGISAIVPTPAIRPSFRPRQFAPRPAWSAPARTNPSH